MDMVMDAQQKKFVFFLILAVIVRVEVAVTAEQKSRGLAGRENLAEGEGMMFVFDQPGQYGFWMKGMKFPLDFVWIREGKVVEVTEDIPVSDEDAPKVYQPQQPIEAMMEVNAGWVRENGVKAGDRIVVE